MLYPWKVLISSAAIKMYEFLKCYWMFAELQKQDDDAELHTMAVHVNRIGRVSFVITLDIPNAAKVLCRRCTAAT